MDKFYATVEFLSGQRACILTITDRAGDWAGSGRIEVRSGHRSDLYEEAYRQASIRAQIHGGRLERFSIAESHKDTTKGLHEIPASPDGAVQALAGTWKDRRAACGACVTPTFLHRSANALNVEPMQPQVRCLNKRPDHWGDMSALRWVASGGDALVFGLCSADCPLEPHV